MGETRRERLDRARLYVVSDARRHAGDLAAFLDTILSAGVDLVQLREKDAADRDIMAWGRTFAEAARDHRALFVLNDRPDLARVLGADGVHVGQEDAAPSAARSVIGPDAIVGLSTHAPGQLAAADPAADYLCAGPVWETPTKPGRPAAGLAYVRHVASAADRPWFAIGGISTDNLDRVVAAGARRIVVVRAVTEAEDPASAVRALLAGLPTG